MLGGKPVWHRILDKICGEILKNGERPEEVLWVSTRVRPEAVLSWVEFVRWLRREDNQIHWMERMLASLQLVVVGDGWWVESDENAHQKASVNWLSIDWQWRFVRPPIWNPGDPEDQGKEWLSMSAEAYAAMVNIHQPKTYSSMGGTVAHHATFQNLLGGHSVGGAQEFGTQQPAPGVPVQEAPGNFQSQDYGDLLSLASMSPPSGTLIASVQDAPELVSQLARSYPESGLSMPIIADPNVPQVRIVSADGAQLVLHNFSLPEEEETQEEWRERVTAEEESDEQRGGDGSDHTF